jgi:hypothetical protein
MQCVECLDGWRVFIALNHQTTVGDGCCRWAHRTVRCATGHCPVRQPRHPTVRVRELLTLEALSSSGTGQALFTIWCASDDCSDFCAHCPRTVALQGVCCSRPLRWIAVTPLVHRTVRWIIAERAGENPRVAGLGLYGPSAPDSPVRQTRAHSVSCSFVFEPYLQSFYWFVLNLYALVYHIL